MKRNYKIKQGKKTVERKKVRVLVRVFAPLL